MPHAAQNGDDGIAGRIEPHVAQRDFAARHNGGGHQPESGTGNVTGYHNVCRLDANGSGYSDIQPVLRHGAGHPEVGKEAFRVVTGDGGLVHGGSSLCQHAGQQYGALDLGAGHGQLIADGV